MRVLCIATALALATLTPLTGLAWPNGPDEDPRLDPPNDPGFGGQWNLWSFVPEEWAQTPGFRQEEIALGTGIHADRAWQVTPGDRRVLVAVLDSGCYWDNRDLVNKYYLNRGELAACKPAPMDPVPAGADEFDVDGSGWFDIRDYYAAVGAEADALAEWDANENGMLDPQDLLIKCSDGNDDDGNGYVDDISGWDFFRDDNDAYDDTRYGHGNGEARDSTAEGNNGMGDIGVCPGCSTLMVRVGDSFVADANDFGQGVIFATDSGASVVQEALGTVNNTRLAQDAINYAYDNNVAIIASAADELSYHHNMPGTNNHTIYVHSIQYDGVKANNSTTFLNFCNCTNFGMQLLLSTPGTGCSSEATGISSGHAGLLYSAALKAELDPPISAEEIKQVMTLTVDDINVNPLDNDPTKFPSDEGWDWHFGYGRPNARASVDAIVAGRIPPEVDIVEPYWFQVIYPDVTPSVEVNGRINQRRDGLPARFAEVSWVLEYAIGVAPRDKDNPWIEIASGTTPGLSGKITDWDVTSVDLDLDAKSLSAHQNAVTVRLRATGQLADGSDITGEHRKGFLFERDPSVTPGFPKHVGSSGESSPVFANIDGGEDEELLVVNTDGTAHVFKSGAADDGEAAGWPVKLDLRRAMDPSYSHSVENSCAFRTDKTGCIKTVGAVDPDVRQTTLMAPAVGDLDGDETLEVVVATWDGWVFVFEHDGTPRPGWPKSVDFDKGQKAGKHFVVDAGFMAAPVLYDLDMQPGLEIVAAAMDQHIYVWHADGTPMAPYPVRVGSEPEEENGERIVCTPAIGDIDGDGKPEIATGTNEALGPSGATNEALGYVLDAETGLVADGWPQSIYGLMVDVLPIVGKGVPTNPLLADLDYDGTTLEISFDTIATQGWFFRHDGSLYNKMNNRDYGASSNSVDTPAYVLMNNGALGYVDPFGGIDFVKGTAGFDFALAFAGGGTLPEQRQPNGAPFDHHISGWDTESTLSMEGFPQVIDDWQFFNTPTIVDLDNDLDPEVVIGSAGYLLHAFNYKGEEPPGWPKQTGGWIMASAAVGDYDGDGLFEVSINTRDGWLYMWETDGQVGSIFEWNGYGHDPHNTNNYELPATPYQPWESTTPVDPDVGPSEDSGAAPDSGSDPGGTTPKPKDDGCRSAPDSGSPALPLAMLAMLLGVALIRRRG